MNVFIDFYLLALVLSVGLNLYVSIKFYLVPFLRVTSPPHVLAIYGANDFDKATMVSNLFNSGLPYTFIDSGITRDYLVRLLEDPEIKIVELSTHGDSEGVVIGDEIFPFGWLKNIFAQTNIKVVLLLSCHSHVYENLMNSGCAVVSLVGEVEDSVVLEYTKEFYHLIAEGEGFRTACVKAKRVLAGQDYHKIQVRWNNNQ